MFLIFMEGVVCVGVLYIFYLCKNMFSLWVMGKFILCIVERFIM